MTKDLTLTDLSNFSNDLKEVPASNVIARAVQENGVDAASKNFAAKKR